jgi:membrane protein
MTWAARSKFLLLREWQHLFGAYERWTKDDGWLMAAAVAYYVGLSFFPLLVMLLSGFGLFLRFTEPGQDAKLALLELVASYMAPGMQSYVATTLDNVQTRAILNGPLALLGVVLTAMAGFVYFERAFDRIWGVPQAYRVGIVGAITDVLIRRGVAFVLMMSFGVVIMTIFFTGIVLSALQQFTEEYLHPPEGFWRLTQIGATLTLNAIMFTLLYRLLSKVRVRWREALRGGVVAALFWELGRQGLTWYLVQSSYGSAYGVIGSFIAVLLWCYYAVAVVFFGAEYIQEFCRYCDGERAGLHATSEADPEPAAAHPPAGAD